MGPVSNVLGMSKWEWGRTVPVARRLVYVYPGTFWVIEEKGNLTHVSVKS